MDLDLLKKDVSEEQKRLIQMFVDSSADVVERAAKTNKEACMLLFLLIAVTSNMKLRDVFREYAIEKVDDIPLDKYQKYKPFRTFTEYAYSLKIVGRDYPLELTDEEWEEIQKDFTDYLNAKLKKLSEQSNEV